MAVAMLKKKRHESELYAQYATVRGLYDAIVEIFHVASVPIRNVQCVKDKE